MAKPGRISRAGFSDIRKRGARRYAGRFFTLSASSAPGKEAFTCVVSKKTAARATDRNALKRHCREAVRAALGGMNDAPPQRYVLRASPAAARATWQEIRMDIAELIRKTKRPE